MSDQGTTYASYVETELKAERERRAAYDARGQALVSSSGALVTLFGGLAAIVKTGSVVRIPTVVLPVVCGALILLAAAATCGIVAGWNSAYTVASTATLQAMLAKHWTDTEVDARNNVSTMHAKTVHTMRAAGNVKARWVSAGLILQVAALLVLSCSIVLIIAAG